MRRTPSAKYTIKDIAEMCNVSTQTVSRVLNKRPDVSSETRQLVEETIARVGYQPSALARSLVQQRSMTLGFVTTGLKYVGIAQTLNGIAEQCEARGYGLLVKDLPESAEHQLLDVIDFFIARHVEGIIILVPGLDLPKFLDTEHLPPQCPPLVFLKSYEDSRSTNIAVDNVGGARTATEHLIGLGRKHIAHIAGPDGWIEARLRIDGWRAALDAAGLAAPDSAVIAGNWTSQSGAECFASLLEAYPELDAVFAANDQMALGAMSVCHRRGLKIPDDVAVIGFDGVSEGEQFTPSLSTVVQPLRQMGQIAVTELLDHIDHPEEAGPARSVVLDVELVARESTLGPRP